MEGIEVVSFNIIYVVRGRRNLIENESGEDGCPYTEIIMRKHQNTHRFWNLWEHPQVLRNY